MKDIKVKVKARHYRLSTGYNDTTSCPLAKALQEMFPKAENIFVATGHVDIDDNRYIIKNFIGADLYVENYGFDSEKEFVEAMKRRVSLRNSVISFDVELISL